MRLLAFAALAAALAGCAQNPYTYDTTTRDPYTYDTSRYVAAPAAPACPTAVTSTGYTVYRC